MNININSKNIVLIGMSGVGKTGVGKYIANKTKRKFIDTDDMIISFTGETIDDIFSKYGEEYFRFLEKKAIKRVASEKRTVISTGGGVVLNNKNIQLLQSNGIIFLLKASINTMVSNIESTPSSKERRPLLKDSSCLRQRIKKIYKEREKIYLASANQIINVDGKTIEKIGDEIIYIFKQLNPCS
ncbi:shikimate kinase [Clostridium sp. Cult2]|uniref:shikimate kinase n=1 Tax=Clostridium sp. Cult2 TaxID=2079003 RepID=UPI001F260AF4|nr:shikimate kinase [Clostridium sp. Cult2]